jgi:hypothetical protein
MTLARGRKFPTRRNGFPELTSSDAVCPARAKDTQGTGKPLSARLFHDRQSLMGKHALSPERNRIVASAPAAAIGAGRTTIIC